MAKVELVISITGLLLAWQAFAKSESDRTLLQALIVMVFIILLLVAWSLDQRPRS